MEYIDAGNGELLMSHLGAWDKTCPHSDIYGFWYSQEELKFLYILALIPFELDKIALYVFIELQASIDKSTFQLKISNPDSIIQNNQNERSNQNQTKGPGKKTLLRKMAPPTIRSNPRPDLQMETPRAQLRNTLWTDTGS